MKTNGLSLKTTDRVLLAWIPLLLSVLAGVFRAEVTCKGQLDANNMTLLDPRDRRYDIQF